jgi:catechol 2,3-dioxygenase-like lactoylglutathione lyase family enzyme
MNVTLMVADMDDAVRFYTETLGLDLTFRSGDHWAMVRGPGLTIALHPKGEHGPAPEPDRGSGVSIGFEVESLAVAQAQLEAEGVSFEISSDEFVNLAYFHDPDGTTLYLMQVGDERE